MGLLKISGSPHVQGGASVKRIMWIVVIALVPALAMSFFIFGLNALRVTLISVVACVAIEFLISKYLLKEKELTIFDGSAVITGLLLAFNLPSSIPAWMVIVGAVIAIGVAKMSFGGLGKNIFNPALVGRVFMLISFPVEMTKWPRPFENMNMFGSYDRGQLALDAFTGPTPLAQVKAGGVSAIDMDYASWFYGQQGGSLGEMCALAIILGGIILLLTKVISWHIPVAYIGTVAIFTGILNVSNPEIYAGPLFHILTGGLMLGAFFMATDMVTSPMSKKGMLVFGLGCGVITVLIRVFGAYPEGVSFAILIMNAFVPLINKAFTPKKFGEVVKNG